MPRIIALKEPCGCYQREYLSVLCMEHWNRAMLKQKLDDCRTWEDGRRLDPSDPCDAVVLNFYRDLVFWAAKGAAAAGGSVRW